MGQRNSTRRELLEQAFPVRLHLRVPRSGHADPLPRALRRVLGHQAHGVLGGFVYLGALSHASALVCVCPTATLDGEWPVRLTVGFEDAQEMLVRDALRVIVGDAGYALASARHHRGGQPAWHLELETVWDAVQFMRMAQPARLIVERWHGRNG